MISLRWWKKRDREVTQKYSHVLCLGVRNTNASNTINCYLYFQLLCSSLCKFIAQTCVHICFIQNTYFEFFNEQEETSLTSNSGHHLERVTG